MKNKVMFEITNCRQCPNVYITRYYTEDSSEMEWEWMCKANSKKHIAIVSWRNNDQLRVSIPEWCPLR